MRALGIAVVIILVVVLTLLLLGHGDLLLKGS